MESDLIDSVCQVEPYRWKKLELFHTVYPDDEFEYNNLDPLFPGKVGTIFMRDDGTIEKIIISRVWPHKLGNGDDDETALYGPNDQ
jgi:hypothetical protein